MTGFMEGLQLSFYPLRPALSPPTAQEEAQ
jgi:hypothetical protein